ncbi:MAG: flagellar basal body-associated FliL family protein [Sulfobacillus sp.]|nr:flagellar basal body-associated FliL family protein [Sulfobacillus sp.]
MKKVLVYLIVFILGVAGGAAGIIFLDPSLLSHQPAPVVEALPYNPSQAVSVTETGIESNLSGNVHYVNFDVEFQVMPQALTGAGGTASGSGSSGSGGTGSPVLDARIRNALIALARSTTYQQLTSSGGMTVFKAEVSTVLQSIFGPGTIGNIYFPSFLTQ